jgi:hypothetical protein
LSFFGILAASGETATACHPAAEKRVRAPRRIDLHPVFPQKYRLKMALNAAEIREEKE